MLSGCLANAAGDEPDGPDDASAKAGTVALSAIVDGSPDALAALRVANSASVTVLRDDAHLTAPAAQNIVARHDGADGVSGTADDRPFYTLAELDAVPEVDPVSLDNLVVYGRTQGFGGGLRVDALPPELAADPLVAGLLGAVAVDSSLMVDGDRLTVVPNEWELTALFAHHFVLPDTAARVAKLRGYMFGSDLRRGPFIDIVTINRVVLGEREPSWALAELLVRTAADPHHTIGRLYAAEVEAALADRDFVAWNPGVAALQRDYVSIWNANVEVADPGDLPLALARTRALLASRGVETFTGAYPVERPVPATVAAMMPLAMPFERGTEIVCMQGNNSMAARSSHGPDQLRYALDLNAPKLTTLVASASGTAYVYAHGRPASFDNYGFGNLLLIDLHNGFALLYAHLTTFAVNNGQDVTAGQIVGTVGLTGAVANNPHVHLQVVPLFRTPDPVHEEYQSDTPIEGPFPAPFGVPEQFSLSAIDVTAGATTGTVIESTAFACGESGRLPGAAHVYRVP